MVIVYPPPKFIFKEISCYTWKYVTIHQFEQHMGQTVVLRQFDQFYPTFIYFSECSTKRTNIQNNIKYHILVFIY